jgi:hypothetical protein
VLIEVIGRGFAIRTAAFDVKDRSFHALPNRAPAACRIAST